MSEWQPIEIVPPLEFVFAYCKEAGEAAGVASESCGEWVGSYRPLPSWDFTHLKPLPELPK